MEKSILLHELLKRHFGFTTFREGQRETCEAILAGHDALVLLPTGGGKSLCYLLPTLALNERGRSFTIVVSPLIALMDDQVNRARDRGIHAAALHSGQEASTQREILDSLYRGALSILYISPERAALDGFRNLCARTKPTLLAIDEAHCISQWGHDFRPEYLQLGRLRQELGIPTVALTATATPRIAQEIIDKLGLRTPHVVRTSFARPNLRFSVMHLAKDAERLHALVTLLNAHGLHSAHRGRDIVYCTTRKKTEHVAKQLRTYGLKTEHYHAGRTDLARLRAQRAYEDGRKPILIATNAFGMGIDRGDVRLIVHYETPASLEAYYQEAGRAGRDGQPAQCVLFFGVRDLIIQRQLQRRTPTTPLIESRRNHALECIERYARATICRQRIFIDYFSPSESEWTCAHCDNCQGIGIAAPARQNTNKTPKRPQKSVAPLDSNALQTIVAAAGALRKPVGKTALAKALRGSHSKALKRLSLLTLPQHGALKEFPEPMVITAIESLLENGTLVRKGRKYPTLWLPGRPVRTRTVMTEHNEATETGIRRQRRRKRQAKSPLATASVNFRRREARSLQWPLYMVFTNDVIAQIETHHPRSMNALLEIRGMGPAKVKRFGSTILKLINEHQSFQ